MSPCPTRPRPRVDAGAMLRWASRGVLAAVIGAFVFQLAIGHDYSRGATAAWVLPPAAMQANPASADPRPFLTAADEAALRRPLSFVLRPDGVLAVTGTIGRGSAARLEAELAAYDGRVGTVALNSPGGALDDAIVMARVLRTHGIATRVEDGALCASSCPLLMAGGVERSAGGKAAVGVHQFYAEAGLAEDPAQAMADAQFTAARIARHLQAMDVDPTLWFRALATPPQALYYLSQEELAAYRLVTRPASPARREGNAIVATGAVVATRLADRP